MLTLIRGRMVLLGKGDFMEETAGQKKSRKNVRKFCGARPIPTRQILPELWELSSRFSRIQLQLGKFLETKTIQMFGTGSCPKNWKSQLL